MSTQQPHIRPKVKTRRTDAKPVISSPASSDVEDLQHRMQAWVGLNDPDSNQKVPAEDTKSSEPKKKFAKPAGILKKPKYTTVGSTPPATNQPTSKATTEIFKNTIVERSASQTTSSVEHPAQSSSPLAVEGYTPRTEPARRGASGKKDTAGESTDSKEPLVLSSFGDLLHHAGHELPTTDSLSDAQVVEAELSFSCMSPQDYQEQKQELEQKVQDERMEHYRLFTGIQPLDEEQQDDEEAHDEEASDGELWELMDQDEEDGCVEDDEDDNGLSEPPPPSAFLLLWKALSDWVTPQAVAYVKTMKDSADSDSSPGTTDWMPRVDESDIGASRCAGLMAMLKMNLPRTLEGLSNQQTQRIPTIRVAEQRLANLVRTFDYSQPSAKLDLKLWRAMTCILLQMTLPVMGDHEQDGLPESIQAVGLKWEEYRYLTRSVFSSLDKGSASS